MNGRWRGVLARAMTLSGLARRGFFIPYRYAAEVTGSGGRPPYPEVEALLRSREDVFNAFLSTIDGFGPELERIGGEPPPAPRWTQDWFPRLDGAAAYALVRSLKPRRVVEVGAGHSTRFVVGAVGDGGLNTTITAIDPAPRADLSRLPVEVVRSTVQEAGDGLFQGLEGGDVLMIDSSHILVPGSDVDVLLNRVLPSLPVGAVVHVHDVFLPDDYPEDWAWRGYNEQLGVAPLLFGGAFEVLFSSRFAATRMAGAVAATVVGRLPLVKGATESSLWLRKIA
ncbi:MAG: class I SAM-dependent methyltransferase [Rhodospirillales bacterium]|jgi:hypothetical protein|nr:class I SAM-dependent methyltransferase [Rhodospirillales bacterium]